jgi:hypothetical protein
MKIPESIIEKYQLVPSGEQTGQSFMQNQLLYKSGLPGFENIVFMECDLNGMPSELIVLFNKHSQRKADVTPVFLYDVPVDEIIKFVI